MKNWRKCFGIIALTAIIGFSMAACDDGNGNGGGGGDGSGALGATLNLSGQVYIADWSDTSVTFERFTDNRTVYSELGGNRRSNSYHLY